MKIQTKVWWHVFFLTHGVYIRPTYSCADAFTYLFTYTVGLGSIKPAISPKRLKIERKLGLLLTAYIKSYTGFRMPPKCMTFNDLCARLKVIYFLNAAWFYVHILLPSYSYSFVECSALHVFCKCQLVGRVYVPHTVYRFPNFCVVELRTGIVQRNRQIQCIVQPPIYRL